uniref:twin-arginine translocation signal domain-containing protein n=1 Tax=Prosthecobacter sp. TaxID=1965333 RepID=UPI003784F44F
MSRRSFLSNSAALICGLVISAQMTDAAASPALVTINLKYLYVFMVESAGWVSPGRSEQEC